MKDETRNDNSQATGEPRSSLADAAPRLDSGAAGDAVKGGNGHDQEVAILKSLASYVVQATFATKDGNPLSKAAKESWHPAEAGIQLDLAQLMAHASKQKVIAVYPIEKGKDVTRVAVLDFDDHGKELEWPQIVAVAKRVSDRLKSLQLSAIFPVRSRRGRGIHLWLPFAGPVPAIKLRAFLRKVLDDCELSEGRKGVAKNAVEIFPRQNSLKPDSLADLVGNEIGSHITLPFAGDSVALDPDTFEIIKPPAQLTNNGTAPITAFQMDDQPASEQRANIAFDEAKLRDALSHLSPDESIFPGLGDYENRLAVGNAIKTTAIDTGFDLKIAYKIWADWTDSTVSARKPRGIRRYRRWLTFKLRPKGSKRITIGSIYHKAREADWTWAGDDNDAAASPTAPPYSDDALALLFTETYATTLRYVAKWNKWLIFNGSKWDFDETLKTWSLARGVCRQEAQRIRSNKRGIAKAIASVKTRNAVISHASSDERHAATTEQWDTDPWLLNTPRGVIDLKTGIRRDHRAEDYMTKMTAVSPDTNCSIPIWKAFLKTTTAGNNDLERFLARVGGYSLTGLTVEQQLFFNYGRGSNGKGVLTNTLIGIYADYHTSAPSETFTTSSFERHPTELADLRGARLVTSTETEQGKQWNEARIKQMTGGDPIKARFMRQDFFEYIPQFKLMMSGNHKPGISAVNEAIKRRVNLIPFLVTIPLAERDEHLVNKLKAEWPGILAWLIEGCLEWQRVGLRPPQVVIDATKDYLSEEDVFGRWIGECFDLDVNGWASSADIFLSWQRWAETNQEVVGSQTLLSKKVREYGFRKQRDPAGDREGFAGLKPKNAFPVTLTMHRDHETEDGILFSAGNLAEPVWLPKSKIEMVDQGNEFFEVIIPGWLAKKKGLHGDGGAAPKVEVEIPF